jgi:hypothetical protein
VKSLLKPGGRFLMVEPWLHVSRKGFAVLERLALQTGFTVVDRPSGKGGRSLLLGP